jgi:hypothetical protein
MDPLPGAPLDVMRETIYLRGTMNNMGQDLPMKAESDGLLHLSLGLPAGLHRFKLALTNWTAFKWGRIQLSLPCAT